MNLPTMPRDPGGLARRASCRSCCRVMYPSVPSYWDKVLTLVSANPLPITEISPYVRHEINQHFITIQVDLACIAICQCNLQIIHNNFYFADFHLHKFTLKGNFCARCQDSRCYNPGNTRKPIQYQENS